MPAGVVLFLLCLAGCGAFSSRSAEQAAHRLELELPLDQLLDSDAVSNFALSPDGSEIVYSASAIDDVDGTRSLYRRLLQDRQATRVPGTEGAQDPFFSPDGGWIGFNAQGRLIKVRLDGGARVVLCDCQARAASWGEDGTIVFGAASGLMRIGSNGGAFETIAVPDLSDAAAGYRPSFLPDGKAVLLDGGAAGVSVVDLETRRFSRLLDRGSGARYVGTGHVVFQRSGALVAAAFDTEMLRLGGTPIMLVDGVWVGDISPSAHFDIARDGTVAFLPGRATVAADRRLVSVDRTGTALSLIEDMHAFAYPRFSPDGDKLAVMMRHGSESLVPTMSGGADIWILDFATTTLRRLTDDGASFFPTWSPDSAHIVFVSRGADSWTLGMKSVDDGADALTLWNGEDYLEPTSWSSDGDRIFLNRLNGTWNWDVWVLRFPKLSLEPFLVSDEIEQFVEPSPDARFLAFVSGFNQVQAHRLTTSPSASRLMSTAGRETSWHPDGTEVFFRRGNEFLSIAVGAEPLFFGSPVEAMFPDRFDALEGGHRNYAVSAESGRFIFVEIPDAPMSQSIHVMVKGFDELLRRVAVHEGIAQNP